MSTPPATSTPEVLTFCTVVTASHLGLARALASGLCAQHPQAQLQVLLADRIESQALRRWQEEYSAEGLRLISLGELPDDPQTTERMCFYYTPFELCCALRGLLHKYLWLQTDVPQWIFLDADIRVVAPLAALWEQLQHATLLLTPHRRKAPSLQHAATLENSLLLTGLYNAGFLGVRRSEEAWRFINWFTARLERYALDDQHESGWFVDQLWLNLTPQYFAEVQSAAHAGANVGHWNLFDARFEYSAHDGAFSIDGEPLLFFHFSGWNIEKPNELSAHARPSEQLPPQNLAAWRALAEAYRDAVNRYASGEYSSHRYAFGHFSDGRPISLWMRRHFWRLCEQNTIPFNGSPFEKSEYFHRAEDAVRPTLRRRFADRLRRLTS
jgi:hypothetical protein